MGGRLTAALKCFTLGGWHSRLYNGGEGFA